MYLRPSNATRKAWRKAVFRKGDTGRNVSPTISLYACQDRLTPLEAVPDLAHNGGLPVMLVHPAEDALVQHQLPDGAMAPRLQDGSQALRH